LIKTGKTYIILDNDAAGFIITNRGGLRGIGMIREFKANDLNRIMKLWLHTNILAHDFIDMNYWKSNYNKVKQMMPEATIFVYEEDNSIKGFVGLSEDYIAGIFVDATCQSKGVRKALLDYIKDRNTDIILQVYEKNNRAVNFYLREGFTVDKKQIDKNINEAELVMGWKTD